MRESISNLSLSKFYYLYNTLMNELISFFKIVLCVVLLCHSELIMGSDYIFFELGAYHKISSSEVELSSHYGKVVTIPNTVYETEYEYVNDEYREKKTSYTVTSIKDNAIFLSDLEKITLPNTLKRIGEKAFELTNLTSITIPNSVTYIGKGAFQNCHQLSQVTLSEALTTIEDETFHGCIMLKSITLPNSIHSIGDGAFRHSSLQSINIPDNVEYIGRYAFMECPDLTSLTLPNSVKSIGEMAFAWCSGLVSINLPNNLTTIEKETFQGCTGLTYITIPNSVTIIKRNAFENCKGLTSITIPKGVKSMDGCPFQGCSLTSLTFHCEKIENWFYGDVNKSITSVIIGDDVKIIGDAAFFGFENLNSVVIGGNVISIGNRAFDYCYGLTSIEIPNSVTSIGDDAFQLCKNLASIIIPNSVTSIGENAFAYCYSLTSIIIPNSITFMGRGSFQQSGLKSITLFNQTIGEKAFYYCNSVETISLGKSVKKIGPDAFPSRSLKKLYCYAETPPEVEKINDRDFRFPYTILYMPESSEESYRNADEWKQFFEDKKLRTRSEKGFSVEVFEPDGITADGTAQMRVSYDPPQSEYTMFDPDLSQARLRFKIEDEECTDEKLTGKADDINWNGWDWGVKCTAPDGFPEEIKEKYYTLQLTLLDQYNGLIGYLGSRDVKVVRPGVILVHGFNSNGKCFGSLANHLVSSGDYEDWQILKADYSSSHWASLDRNTFEYGVINESAYDLFSQMEENNILSASYDIVGHSMGGLLARKFAQDGKIGAVNRIITVNTPHSGSEWASEAVFVGSSLFVYSTLIDLLNIVGGDKKAILWLALKYLARAGWKLADAGAITDLAKNSSALISLNSRDDDVPVHAVCSYMNSYNYVGSETWLEDIFPSFSSFFSGVSYFFSDHCDYKQKDVAVLNYLFNNAPNDGVVTLISQKGGLNGAQTTIISEPYKGSFGTISPAHHLNITDYIRTSWNIHDLLKSDKYSEKFSQTGFHPYSISSEARANVENYAKIDFKEPTESQFVKLTVEKEDTARVIHVKVDSSDDMKACLVFASLGGYNLLSGICQSEYRFRIPDAYDGDLTIFALGRANDDAIAADSAVVHFESLAELESIYFDELSDTVYVVGQDIDPEVIGKWDNGEETCVRPTFTTDNDNVVKIENGEIIAVAEGESQLTADYKGKRCSLHIIILPPDEASEVSKPMSTGNAKYDVYNITGVKVRNQVTSLKGLPKGIYIVNGQKQIVK